MGASAPSMEVEGTSEGDEDDENEDEAGSEAGAGSSEVNTQQNEHSTDEQQHNRRRNRQYSTNIVLKSYKVVVRPNGKKLQPGLIGMHLYRHGYKSVIDCVPKFDSVEIRFSDRIEANNAVFDPFFEDVNIGIPADLVEVDCAFDVSHIVGLDSLQTVVEHGIGRFGDPAIKPVRVLQVQRLSRAVAGNNQDRIPSNTMKITFEGTVRPKFLCINFLKVRLRDFTHKVRFCDKCQKFGHTNVYCRRKQKCGRCENEHKTSECNHPTKNKTLCPSCNAAHGTAWLDCPYVREVEKAYKAKQRAESRRRYKEARDSAQAQAALAKPHASVPPKDSTHFPVLRNTYANLSGVDEDDDVESEDEVSAQPEHPKESYAFPPRPRNIYVKKQPSARVAAQQQSTPKDSSPKIQRSAPKRSRAALNNKTQEPPKKPVEPRSAPIRARGKDDKAKDLRMVIIALAGRCGMNAALVPLLEAFMDPLIAVLLPYSDAFLAAVNPIVVKNSQA